MDPIFIIAAAVALLSSVLVVTRRNAAHAAMYLVVSLLAVAVVFFALGAPFVGALEIIVYAGAIMVLILFVIMLLSVSRSAVDRERRWLTPRMWIGPAVLVVVLGAELVVVLTRAGGPVLSGESVGVKAVAGSLFGAYVLGVELASMLLLAGLAGAYHLAARREER